jgi:ribonuclease HI
MPHAATSGVDVVIYTDGGCRNNPGPGGYGVVLLHDGRRQELYGGYAKTTNNRMELTACIIGLESLDRRHSVVVYSDSQYVVNGIEKGWARKWKANNWKRTAHEMAENSDLWARLLDACDKHEVKFRWVRGHDGNRENERCDVLAVEMSHCDDLPPDHGYRPKQP